MKHSQSKQSFGLSPILRRATVAAFILALSTALIGCGEQAYQNIASITSAQAPGSYTIPPKVDIVLVQDDTGSMNEAFGPIATQMPKLLESLEAQGWDYHFAVIPLTKRRLIDQVVASKYDGNWGSSWLSPYPGAIRDELLGNINSWNFRTPRNFTDFLTSDDLSNTQLGYEDGFENIRRILTSSNSSNFLRNDALLAIVMVGNGNDTSGIEYVMSNGISVPRYAEQPAESFEYYRQQFQNLKPNSSQVKFYAAVSPRQTTQNCLGAPALIGLRYQKMAKALGGDTYDICTQSIASVLASIAQNLKAQKLNMRTRYLFVDQEPNPSSIVVTRYVGGSASNPVSIPALAEDGVNGWKYVGKVENAYTIDSPIPMNQASGYAIELFGTAKLVGNDTAKVEFMPAWVK